MLDDSLPKASDAFLCYRCYKDQGVGICQMPEDLEHIILLQAFHSVADQKEHKTRS